MKQTPSSFSLPDSPQTVNWLIGHLTEQAESSLVSSSVPDSPAAANYGTQGADKNQKMV
jgi:hypothetical protein